MKLKQQPCCAMVRDGAWALHSSFKCSVSFCWAMLSSSGGQGQSCLWMGPALKDGSLLRSQGQRSRGAELRVKTLTGSVVDCLSEFKVVTYNTSLLLFFFCFLLFIYLVLTLKPLSVFCHVHTFIPYQEAKREIFICKKKCYHWIKFSVV